jgi:hypothetical protein
MTLKPDQILTNQGHIHIGTHTRINNLTSIHFDYQLDITIWSKEVSVQNKNLKNKTHKKQLLMQINPRLVTNQFQVSSAKKYTKIDPNHRVKAMFFLRTRRTLPKNPAHCQALARSDIFDI